MINKLKSGALALFIGVGFVNSAQAQFSTNNRSGPTDISADSANVTGKNVLSLRGQVDVRQGDTRILADEMDIYTKGSANDIRVGDFDRVVATGNFYYLTPEQEVRGERGVYENKTETFTVTGDVILLQGDGNVVTGDRLVYDLSTNEARIIGTCKGRKCGRTGRVHILIKNSGSQTRSQTQG